MGRRRFLKILLAILGSSAFVSFFYPLTRFLAPPKSDARTGRVVINRVEIPLGSAKNIVFNNVPAIVINRRGKGLIAFSRICTHLGCLVDFDRTEGRLICPCHGGTFDFEGNVLSGPPPKPLPELPLRVEGDSIVIG
jgi:cytochrome b6-f complex iron-sulfur subunit